MAGQTQFNATLLAEIQNNIGNATTLTDVGKTLAASTFLFPLSFLLNVLSMIDI